MRQRFRSLLQFDMWNQSSLCRKSTGADDQFCIYIGSHTTRKFRCRDFVHRHCHNAPQHAAEKCRHPLGAVLAPQHHPIALADFPALQLSGKAECQLRRLAITPAVRSKPAPVNKGSLLSQRVMKLRVSGKCLGHLSLTYRFGLKEVKRQRTAN